MFDVAKLTASNVGVLLILIASGYILRRSGKIRSDGSKVLSTLAASLFCPAYSLRNLWRDFTLQRIGENALVIGYGLIFVLGIIGLALVLAHLLGRNDLERRSLTYAFSIPNYGYFGYPIIAGVFGQEMLTKVLIFTFALGIATNSYGYLLFVPDGKLSVKKIIGTPLMLAQFIGIGLGLSGLPMPDFIDRTLELAGNCMSPVAMILAGVVLGCLPMKELLCGWHSYWISAIRLLGVPAIVGGLLWLIGIRGEYLLMPMLVCAMPLGLNLVVYPESQGMDAIDNAKMCCVSYLLAIVILPIEFGLLGQFA